MPDVLAVRRRDRKVVKCFRAAGAIGAASAKHLDELHLRRSTGLRRLLNRTIIREVPRERFYLDEEVWADAERRRRGLALIVTAIVLLVLVGWLFLGGIVS
jgi:hypothetical protein